MMKKRMYHIVKKLIDNWPWVLPVLFVFAGVMVWKYAAIKPSDKISVSVLLGTAIIYSLQFINMRQSSKNQEMVLKQQCDIAQKQHNFDVFTLRMNLRNELVRAFTIALSSEDLSITNDVNTHLVNIGKICDDIKFAFPQNKELDSAIKAFKKSCTEITKIAPEKQYIIECDFGRDDRITWLRYKDCLEVFVRGQIVDKRVINPKKAQDLHISQKERTIICGIMGKYILVSQTKDGIENYVHNLFHKEMDLGNSRLKKICEILDKDIKL